MIQKIILTVAVIAAFIPLAAQESENEKSKEYWLSAPLPQNFNPFSLTFDYKVNLKNNTWLSISALDLSFGISKHSHSNSYEFASTSMSYSGGLGVGLEFRKVLSPKLTLFHGPQLYYGYSNDTYATMDPSYAVNQRKVFTRTHSGGINYPIGLMYSINDHLFIAAQLTPGAALHYTDYENRMNPTFGTQTTSGSFGFTDNVGSVSIVLRR